MKTKQLHHAYYYATALYELAKEQKLLDQILSEMEELAQIFELVPQARQFLELTFLSDDVKQAMLEKVFGKSLHPILFFFLKILVVKDHFSLFPTVLHLYCKLTDESLGRVRASVTTAVPLKDAEIQEIEQMLSAYFHQQAVVSTFVDQKILGGMIVHVKDLWLDSSIASHLKRIHKKVSAKAQELAHTVELSPDYHE